MKNTRISEQAPPKTPVESTTVTSEKVMDCLKEVIDPELGIDVVSLGLIYDVQISPRPTEPHKRPLIHVLLTLTTPGCPLAGVFDSLIKEALKPLPSVVVEDDVFVELTFDPPWIPEMMTEEARATLGFD